MEGFGKTFRAKESRREYRIGLSAYSRRLSPRLVFLRGYFIELFSLATIECNIEYRIWLENVWQISSRSVE